MKPLKKTRFIIIALLLVCSLFITGCDIESPDSTEAYPLAVSFVDVGQGDGILIEYEDKVIVIDGGEADGNRFVNYLKKRQIDVIDYYIATHPHSDHIGAIPSVLYNYDVSKFIMTEFSPINIPTTKCFENMLQAVDNEECEVIAPTPGQVITENELTLTFLAPLTETDDYNNMSIVVKMEFRGVSFLFMGDAEKETETALLENGSDLSADVLKVGHHGSNTATGTAFLAAVKPDIAVISCGVGNDYGHPHEETLSKLTEFGCEVCRTDTDGTVLLVSDGSKIKKQ